MKSLSTYRRIASRMSTRADPHPCTYIDRGQDLPAHSYTVITENVEHQSDRETREGRAAGCPRGLTACRLSRMRSPGPGTFSSPTSESSPSRYVEALNFTGYRFHPEEMTTRTGCTAEDPKGTAKRQFTAVTRSQPEEDLSIAFAAGRIAGHAIGWLLRSIYPAIARPPPIPRRPPIMRGFR